jgi:hypothetical protein
MKETLSIRRREQVEFGVLKMLAGKVSVSRKLPRRE